MLIKDYLDNYKFPVDEGKHILTENERVLIDDILEGLLNENKFLENTHKIFEYQEMIKSLTK
jgi:hypothetical protein